MRYVAMELALSGDEKSTTTWYCPSRTSHGLSSIMYRAQLAACAEHSWLPPPGTTMGESTEVTELWSFQVPNV